MSEVTQWALLWSKRQNCFHIEPANELTKKNKQAMFDDKTLNDYHPVAIGSREFCERVASESRHLLMSREVPYVV